MSDAWTQKQVKEIRHLAPLYGWQGTHKDGDVIRWINARAPACLEEYKRRAEESHNEADSKEAQATGQAK